MGKKYTMNTFQSVEYKGTNFYESWLLLRLLILWIMGPFIRTKKYIILTELNTRIFKEWEVHFLLW